MGVKQNLNLWENHVSYLDENGNKVTKRLPRTAVENPYHIARLLSARAWVFFFVGLAAWAADGYDFNAVNLVATNLATVFERSQTTITLSVTLTLLVRAIGAAVFGILSDMFGRKWIMSIDLVILAGLQVGTAFAPTFNVFVGVRTLFGVAMGGIWGLSAAIALENMPVKARGLFSGILQNGYAMGYVLAAMVNIVAVPATSQGYRMIFFVGAGFTALIALVIAFIPESVIFANTALDENGFEIEDEQGTGRAVNPRKRVVLFLRDASLAARQYWPIFLYCVLFTTAYNWMTHAIQDIYPSYLKIQKGFTSRQASLATIVGQCGAIIGGPTAGYYSQFFGRRLTSIVCVLIAAVFIPLYTLPTGFSAVVCGTFFLQAAVNAAWGIMPVMLNEYAPPQFRGVFPGLAYQLGSTFSAPAAQAQTAAASAWIVNGLPNYTQVMTIFMCVIFLVVIIVTACGPESLGSHFEVIKRAGHIENITRAEIELGRVKVVDGPADTAGKKAVEMVEV